MLIGQVAIEQIGLNARPSGAKHLFRNFAARLKPATRQGDSVPRPTQLELQLVVVARQHDEAALGAADRDSRVHHQGQHVVQHLTGTEGPEPLEQHRHLVHLADRRTLAAAGSGIRAQKHELGATAAPQLDPIPMGKTMLLHLLTVDERPIPGPLVTDFEAVADGRDLRVIPRHLPALQMEIAPHSPPDGERILLDVHNPPTELIGYFEFWLCHGRRRVRQWVVVVSRVAVPRTIIPKGLSLVTVVGEIIGSRPSAGSNEPGAPDTNPVLARASGLSGLQSTNSASPTSASTTSPTRRGHNQGGRRRTAGARRRSVVAAPHRKQINALSAISV